MSKPLGSQPGKRQSPITRILVNVAWLLGGKGFAAVCSVIYLAILARTLGLKGFGHFSLIVGTAQALVAIAGFQTWRVVVRYGVSYVHHAQWDRFGRLVMLCGIMDAVGAVCGCALAWVMIYVFGPYLSLNPAYVDIAFWYCCVSLWALTSSMTGVLRTLDRFDIMVYVEAVPVVSRLIAALAIWWTSPTVAHFLAAWAGIALLEAAAYWIMGRRLAPEAVKLRYLRDWRTALNENPEIWRFLWVTYIGATLDAAVKQGPLLAVGAFVGTRSAGLYRMASQLAQALSKLSTLITRAVYPEVARARFTSEHNDFARLAFRISLFAGLAGLVVVGAALLLGRNLLGLIGGADFSKGAVILVPLAIAASLDLASVAFEPVLHSTGRVRLSLTARLLEVVALGVGLWLFVETGPSGAAWAVALGGGVSYLAMGIMAWRTLHHIGRHQVAAAPVDPASVELGSTPQ